MTQPDDIGRVNTPESSKLENPRLNGIPIHLFWAQVASMFIDNDFVKITDHSIINIIKYSTALISVGQYFSRAFHWPDCILFAIFIFSNLTVILLLTNLNIYTPIF